MLLNSRVCLSIYLKGSTGAEVTSHLGIEPSEIWKSTARSSDKTLDGKNHYWWRLHSPKDANFELGVRLEALANVLAPIATKIVSLDASYRRSIDVYYVTSPQHPDRISGEFFWWGMSPAVMGQFGACNLGFSYEILWRNQPKSK